MDLWNLVISAMNQWIHDQTIAMMTFFQITYLVHPKPNLDPLVQYMYMGALGLGQFLSIAIAAVLVPFGLLFMKIGTAWQAAKSLAVILLLGPYFFAFCDWLADLSDSLSAAFIVYTPPDGKIFATPQIDGVGAGILSYMFIAFWGVMLYILFTGYTLVGVFAEFVALPIYSLRPFGEMMRKWADWIISILFVVLFAGRPVAMFIISLFEWVGGVLLKLDAVASAITLGLSFLFAFCINIAMFFVTKKVISWVRENVKSLVSGRVFTKPQDRQKVDVGKVEANYASSLQVQPVSIVEPPRPSQSRQVIEGAKHMAGTALMAKVATVAATSTTPVGAVANAAMIGMSVLNNVKNGGAE